MVLARRLTLRIKAVAAASDDRLIAARAIDSVKLPTSRLLVVLGERIDGRCEPLDHLVVRVLLGLHRGDHHRVMIRETLQISIISVCSRRLRFHLLGQKVLRHNLDDVARVVLFGVGPTNQLIDSLRVVGISQLLDVRDGLGDRRRILTKTGDACLLRRRTQATGTWLPCSA